MSNERNDFDLGCNVLDLIAHCDEGRQEAAINEHFADARRRTLQLGGGKLELKITIKADLSADNMPYEVTYEIKSPTRKAPVKTNAVIDTDIAPGTRTVIGSTMHIGSNPRQTTMDIPPPQLVPVPGKDRN